MTLINGCGDSETSSETTGQNSPSAFGFPTTDTQPEPRPGEALAVVILPENPTVSDELYAKATGVRAPVAYAWRKNGVGIDEETRQTLAPDHLAKGDTIEVSACSGPDEVVAEVVIGNSPPVLKSVELVFSEDIKAQPRGEDADGDEVGFRYLWLVNGEELPWEDQAVLPSDRVVRGDRVAIRITPFDGEGDGEPKLSNELTVENKPPRIVSTPPSSFNGPVFSYAVKAEDPDGDELTFSLESPPEGLVVDPRTGIMTWNLTENNFGEYRVKVKAEDALGMWTRQEFPLIIKAMDGQ